MTESNRFQLQLNADYTEANIEGFSGAGIFLEANDEIYLYGIFTRFIVNIFLSEKNVYFCDKVVINIC